MQTVFAMLVAAKKFPHGLNCTQGILCAIPSIVILCGCY